jgi:hypothetical protein
MAPYAPTDARAVWSLVAGFAGVALGVLGLLAGVVVLLAANGEVSGAYVGAPVFNLFGIGIPALALGPLAYFLGKAVRSRIAATGGRVGGAVPAAAGSIIGIIATVLGAATTLGWLVILLLGYFGLPPG